MRQLPAGGRGGDQSCSRIKALNRSHSFHPEPPASPLRGSGGTAEARRGRRRAACRVAAGTDGTFWRWAGFLMSESGLELLSALLLLRRRWRRRGGLAGWFSDWLLVTSAPPHRHHRFTCSSTSSRMPWLQASDFKGKLEAGGEPRVRGSGRDPPLAPAGPFTPTGPPPQNDLMMSWKEANR